MCQPEITATRLLGLRRSGFASSPGQVKTDGPSDASRLLSSQEGQGRWDPSAVNGTTAVGGGPRGCCQEPGWMAGTDLSWAGGCRRGQVWAPGRCHTVREHGARSEEPARRTQAARGAGQRERRGGGRPPPTTPGGTRCCFKGSCVGVFKTPEQSQKGRPRGFLSGAKGVAPCEGAGAGPGLSRGGPGERRPTGPGLGLGGRSAPAQLFDATQDPLHVAYLGHAEVLEVPPL